MKKTASILKFGTNILAKSLFSFILLISCAAFAQQMPGVDLSQLPFDEAEFVQSAREQGIPDYEIFAVLKANKKLQKSGISTFQQQKDIYEGPFPQPTADDCNNISFESGDFTNWEGRTGCAPNAHNYYNPISSYYGGFIDYNCNNGGVGCCPTVQWVDTGINAAYDNPLARHTITTGNGLDPCGQFPVVAPGSNYSVRLGNSFILGQAEQIVQTFQVTNANAYYTYQYAVVIQEPTNATHDSVNKPYFEIIMFDENNDTIPCSYYFVSAGLGIPGFKQSTTCIETDPNLKGVAVYKPWSSVFIDLTAYMNQTVTIKFTTADCAQGGHYGYAYVDGFCKPMDLIQEDTLCFGDQTWLRAPDGGASYEWNTGDTTQNILVSTPDTFEVTITSFNGCPTVLKKIVVVLPYPTADFEADTVCVGDFTSFTDLSTISFAGILDSTAQIERYWWDFGDGSPIDTTQYPMHQYATAGIYQVKLKVGTNHACVDSIIIPVMVEDYPVVNLSAPSLCLGNPTQFTDSTTIGVGSIETLEWDLGDGTLIDSIQHPVHTYQNPGTYIVNLIAMTPAGCMSANSISVEVYPGAVAGFVGENVCLNERATQFTDQTDISAGVTIGSWDWDFGEPASGGNNSSNSQNPTHLYASAGAFDVTLVVTSTNGCTDSARQTVHIHPLPTAEFTSNEVCDGDSTCFTDQSTIATGSIVSWAWNFGDSSSGASNLSTAQSPCHVYSAPDNYTTLLTVESDSGCVSSVSYPVVVHPIPTPLFDAPDLCLGLPTVFSDSSLGNIVTWNWNFGDGSPISRDQNPTHTYQNPGTYTITLTVSNGVCLDSVTATAEVFPVPTANFGLTPNPASVLEPTIYFKDLSIGADSGTWNFGVDSATVPYVPGEEHTYTYPDENVPGGYRYVITLDVINQYGCPDVISKPVVIDPVTTLFVPDAFSPNGDAINDAFFAKGMGIMEYEMWIFDRWGNSIFHCDVDDVPQHPLCHWDGKVQDGPSGVIAQQDVYVWLIVYKDFYEEIHRHVGHVTMVR